MTTKAQPLERKLPGEPIPCAELVRRYEDMTRRNTGPVESFLRSPYPEAETLVSGVSSWTAAASATP